MTTMIAQPAVFSVGQIAQRLNVPIHRVVYVAKSRGIRPSAWAGHARVFTEADIDRIGQELEQIARRANGSH